MNYLKKILFLSLLIFGFSCTQKNTLKFKISSDVDEISNYEKIHTIHNPNSKLDIHFYKKHFGMFYGLNDLKKPEFKNQEIIKWASETLPKDISKNWVESFKYDAEGKLIEYKYSSCVKCSQVAWGYKLIYNENDDVVEQMIYNLNQKNFDKKNNLKPNSKFDERMLTGKVKLIYNKNKDLIQIINYNKNGIEKSVKLI